MSKRRRGKPAGADDAITEFWGVEADQEPVRAIQPTTDPGALPRSLGAPPLSARSGVALASLTTVYEEAVRTATALAAANGLLSGDALSEDA